MSEDHKNIGLGFGCAAIAVFCFGTNFLPVKKYKTGDGVFFQWIMCSAIFVVGFFVEIARGSPRFEPLAVVGGILWCTGNMACVPIINLVGMGLGMLLWGGSNLVMGWASGRFGLFGIDSQDVNYPTMNIIGVIVCFCSMGIMFFVKSNPTAPTRKASSGPDYAQLGSLATSPVLIDDPYNPVAPIQVDDEMKVHDKSFFDTLPPNTKRALGLVLALGAGCFFGLNFNPPQYIIDQAKHNPDNGHSTNSLDYVFSHFTGIYITSTFYFMVYAAFKRNQPVVYPELILPAFVSGLIWSIAQVSYFVANDNLEFVVSFPIITTGPGIVASLCGIFLFQEITGKRNFIFLASAIAVTITGVTIITLSKVMAK